MWQLILLVVGLIAAIVAVRVYNLRRSRRKTGSGGWQPGSVGALSAEIGYDIRDLWVAGYTDKQISRVRQGEITLQELLASEPEGNPQNPNR